MRAKSTYATAFDKGPGMKAGLEKTPDNIKNNGLWMGRSTYGSAFNQPNPENYAKRVKNT